MSPFKTIKKSFEPDELDIELDGKNGIKIRRDKGDRYITIEFKDKDGNWYTRPYIKSILINIDAEELIPLVLTEEYVLP